MVDRISCSPRSRASSPVGDLTPDHAARSPRHGGRDHGGNLDAALALYGGLPDDWIDLSTGINRRPYPLPDLSTAIWQRLPTDGDLDSLIKAASRAYATNRAVLPVAGAQAAIQLIPRLRAPGHAAVLGPTYNEHRAALEAQGWQVTDVAQVDDLRGADLGIVVNPNNPDGRLLGIQTLRELARDVGRLVVDESFIDPTPDCSLAPYAGERGLIVLRSFGKFYGLAGLRLGFVIASDDDAARIRELAGPWQVSGPAIEIGRSALGDTAWALNTMRRLHADAARLDGLIAGVGWKAVGGTALFRLYDTNDAKAAQARLAWGAVWSRIFPWSRGLVRLGLPGNEREWRRLEVALEGPRA